MQPSYIISFSASKFSSHLFSFSSMANCFQQPINQDEDSAVLFSASDSPEGSTSPSSTYNSQSPPQLNSTRNIGYKLRVKNLSYTLQGSAPIHILKSVSFVANSAEIVAVVGPSGTGKSTLLKIVSGRVKNKDFDQNSITINGRQIASPSQLKKICGFIAQEDDLLPLLTVKETLMFSAKFRLREMSSKEKEERVENLMEELGLIHVKDSFVGDDDNRGVSGGERKRISIGVDMIHDPHILLLDEPTSGLDSTSALQVIDLLSSMAKNKNRTIILSIHQPSYRILHYISNFLILSSGSVIHNGTLESLESAITRMGFEIPDQLNALEFSMEIISTLEANLSEDPKTHVEESSDETPSDPYSIWPEEELNSRDQLRLKYNKGNSYFWQLFEIIFLCSRFWKIIYRTKQLFFARTMQAIVGGVGLGSVFLKVGKDETGVAERLGLFAFSLSFLLSSTVEALPIYLQERRVIFKESSRGAYKISSYMIASTIVFIPFLLVVAILFSVPVYWLVGLNPSIAPFAFFTFVVWLIVLMASSLVLFLSAISPDFISGNSLICMVLGAFFLFSGYFIPKESIPNYWIFMYYVSLYRYPLDTLLINEYLSVKEECFSWQADANGNLQCMLTGYDVLKSRGLESDSRWINVGIMLGFFLFYRLLCWIILARRASKTTI